MASDEPVPGCGRKALRRLRDAAEGMLTTCCCAPGHDGQHVYCLKVAYGIDHHSHALHYMEEIARNKLKPIVIFEMRDPMTTDADCVALWQYMEHVREIRFGNIGLKMDPDG